MAGELEAKKSNWIEGTREYVGEIRSEMKRVTWPTWERVQSTTVVVIISVFIFAAYFKIVDSAVSKAVVRIEKVFVK